MRGLVSGALVAAVLPVLVGVGPAHASVPRCHGRPATIVGTSGDDHLVGTPGPDVIVGRGGDDSILGRGGGDTICAGRGDDEVFGGNGDDRIYGGPGDLDRIWGETGSRVRSSAMSSSDVIRGGAGTDLVKSYAGNDRVSAGPGNDRVVLWSEGTVSVAGGPGDDGIFSRAPGAVRLVGGSGSDHVVVDVPLVNRWVARGGAGTDNVALRLFGPGHSGLTFDEAAGTVTTVESSGASTVGAVTGFEDDDLRGRADFVFRGDDRSTYLDMLGGRSLTATMGGGDDRVRGTAHHDVLDGGDGRDVVELTSGNDTCTSFEKGVC